jgi:hypothetical protein
MASARSAAPVPDLCVVGHNPAFAPFTGGRSGSGKNSVACQIHEPLSIGVMHACIEGDILDLAYPPPWEQRLAGQTWQFRPALIYTCLDL